MGVREPTAGKEPGQMGIPEKTTIKPKGMGQFCRANVKQKTKDKKRQETDTSPDVGFSVQS